MVEKQNARCPKGQIRKPSRANCPPVLPSSLALTQAWSNHFPSTTSSRNEHRHGMGAKRGSVSHFQGKCETETLAQTMNPCPATKELGDGVHEEGRPRRSEPGCYASASEVC